MLTRRAFLGGSLAAVACRHAPAVHRPPPRITHGVQSGDVGGGRGFVWARCDEPARMLIEWDTSERFDRPQRVVGPVVTPETDLAATVELTGLPDEQTVLYRVHFEREA